MYVQERCAYPQNLEGQNLARGALRHNHTRTTTKKNKRKMAKSDELATKEMPFRCYVGYDSHEDITFEVRVIRSLLLFPLVVRREHFARYVF